LALYATQAQWLLSHVRSVAEQCAAADVVSCPSESYSEYVRCADPVGYGAVVMPVAVVLCGDIGSSRGQGGQLKSR